MPASGPDTYRCFVLPTNLVSDIYVSAIDFRPVNARVVHHINAFLDTTGAAGPGTRPSLDRVTRPSRGRVWRCMRILASGLPGTSLTIFPRELASDYLVSPT